MNKNLATFLGVGLGIVTTLILGQFLAWALKKSVRIREDPPDGIDQQLWDAVTMRDAVTKGTGEHGAPFLGTLERVLFLACFWTEAYIAIAGWLGFKAASKWATWQHIIKVPINIPKLDLRRSLDYLRALNQWGSRVLAYQLIGTLYNVLSGLVAAIVGRFFSQFLQNR